AVQHLSRVDALGRAAAQAQQQKEAQTQQQIQQWAQQQDKIFEASVKDESPETRKTIESNVLKVMQEKYGISKDELRTAYNSIPAVRSASFQKLLWDVTKMWTLKEQVAAKIDRSPPAPPQRPGTSNSRASAETADVEAARAKFLKN